MIEFIKSVLDNEKQEVIRLRRELHKLAEISGQEYKTAEFIEEYLQMLGLKPWRSFNTGVVAFLDAGKKETILLRADMDALPIREPHDAEFKSETDGVMHACGHDAHMAMLLCTAHVLCEHCDKLNVNVLFVFQPLEETDGGAEQMLADGLVEKYNVAEALGAHVMNDVPSGKIMIKPGALMASPDDFVIKICGRGGHGSAPQECLDPIKTACALISELNAITHSEIKAGEHQVVQVCMINAGTSCNIIPDTAEIQGTARSFDEDVRRKIPEIMEEIIKRNCKKCGLTYEFGFNFRYPPVVNNETVAAKMQNAVKNIMGDIVINWTEPIMAGDDFSYFAKAVPANYFYVGTGNEKKGITMPLHSSHFEIDEDGLIVGVGAYISYILTGF